MYSMKKIREKLGHKIDIILLLFVTLIVLYISLKDDFFDVVDGIKNLNLFWVFIALILVFGYYFFRALSLYTFARKFNSKFRFRSALRMTYITQFFDGITPSSSGGQPYQVYSLSKNNISVIDATSIAIQNFIVYQIALVLLGFIAVFLNMKFDLFSSVGLIKKLVIIGFIVNILVITVLFALAFLEKTNKIVMNFIIKILSKLKIVKDKDKKINDFNGYIERFHAGASTLMNDKLDFIKTIVYNFIGLSVFYLIPVVILYGTGDYSSFNFLFSIVSSAYVMLIGAFVPIPGGGGGLEYAFSQFYGVFVSGALLTLIMILWRFLTYYLGVIVGAILLNIRGSE